MLSARCSLNGEVLVSGAGYVRRVQQQETDSVQLGDSIASMESAVENLLTQACERAPESANAEFEDFIRALDT